MKLAHLSVVMERSHVHVEIYYAIMITRQVAFEEWTPRTSPNVPRPAVSYSTDEDGRPTITLYDNPWEKNAGKSSWKNGGVPISEDDPEYGVIAKKRTKMIDEYDIYLPPIYKFDTANSGSLPPQVQEDHIKMQHAMMIVSISIAVASVDIPPSRRNMYEYAELSAQTFAKSVAAAERDGKPTFSFSVLYNYELNPAQTTVMEDLMDDCAEKIW